MHTGPGLWFRSSFIRMPAVSGWCRHISGALVFLAWILNLSLSMGQSDPVSVLTVNNGLASGTIECAIFDSKGFLWVGTRAGLHRYDGEKIVRYTPDVTDPASITSTNILFLDKDRYGHIWIIGDKGLDVFLPEENCFEHLPSVIADDFAGLLIIDSLDIGIVHTARHVTTQSPVISLRERNYISTKSALTHEQRNLIDQVWINKLPDPFFANQENQTYNYRKYFSDQSDEVVRINRQKDGIWFYTRKKGGFTKLTDGKPEAEWKPVNHPWPDIEKEGLMTMMNYNDTLGIAGLFGFGILLFHKHTGEVIRSWDFRKNPLLARVSNIELLTKDPTGRIWFSLMPYGLYVLDPVSPRFQLLKNAEEGSILHKGLMRSLMCDTAGRLWIGYHDGVVQLMDSKVEKEVLRFIIPKDRNHVRTPVTSMEHLSDGQIFINNHLSVSLQDDNIQFKTLFHPDSTFGNSFCNPVFPPEYISFSYGLPPVFLARIGKNSVVKYFMNEKVPAPIRSFCIGDQRFFFASINKGLGMLSCKDSDSCRLISPILYTDYIITGIFHAPDSDTLWFTSNEGLGHYHLKSMEVATENTKSWPNSYLYGILPDDEGNLWISSNGGLIRYNPITKATRFFGIPEGMQSNEFNANCFAKMTDGSLAFGGPEGLNVFHPSYFHDRDEPFYVHATAVTISERNVPSFNPFRSDFSITLAPHDRSVEVDYSATKFLNRTGLTYFVKLEGADQNWVDRGEQESVRYINLKPNTYRLRIKAKDGMGNWSENEVSGEIIVRPTFFQTTWFLLLCVVFVGGILYTLYQYRIRQLKKIIRIRSRIGRDLHDDIGSTLGSISIYSEVAKSTSGDHRTDVLDKIGEASREMLEKLNDIVWSINPENDGLERMEKRMRTYAAMLLNPLGISFELTLKSGDLSTRLDMDHRRHLFLIFKEALHNAVKYSECRLINIILTEQNGSVQMEISDDGKGFDPLSAAGYNGNGLDSMKDRAKAIGANLVIDSKPGQGTKIYLWQK